MNHHIRSGNGSPLALGITPETAGWQYLSFRVFDLPAEAVLTYETAGEEIALVPLAGSGIVRVGESVFELARTSVFAQMPQVLYAPPGIDLQIDTAGGFEFAIGGAPAEGRYPLRLFEPSEMKQEIRGGGAARRQVNHILNHPLPAERLILFEVYVPGGMWSGYPPHCHDGYMGSPVLEEIYYYRIEPGSGFAIHRNYRKDGDFDELFTVRDRDAVLVTQGFHPVAAAPGSNVYFLNYLAGEPEDDERGTPPYDDPDWSWIKEDWEARALGLPAVSG
ncbi:MAG TPA: 5-deoxy-glucuronate isomerase [Anaerolineales bacterium]|nr:5-deoxy-glucuronate isomerase [Anaerolineales bacterium]